jgi:hypothetical protein
VLWLRGPTIGRGLCVLVQVSAAFHLGVLNSTSMLQPAMHYKLFTACPDEYEKLVQLVALARHIRRAAADSSSNDDGISAMRRMKLDGEPVRFEEDDGLLRKLLGGLDVKNAGEGEGGVPQTVVEFDFVASKAQLRTAMASKMQAKLKATQVVDKYRMSDGENKVRGLQRMWRQNIQAKRDQRKAEALAPDTPPPTPPA